MENIKTINIFDFDETFVRAPGYTNKKAVENAHPELKFNTPYEYYDHKKSLCEDIHNIQVIEPVYKAWKAGMADIGTLTVLITHRIDELRPEVISILEKRNIEFDRYHFLGRIKKKPSILEKLIIEHPGVKKVRVFEDSIQQLALYQNFFKNNDTTGIELEMYIVDKSKMYKISNFNLTDEISIRLI